MQVEAKGNDNLEKLCRAFPVDSLTVGRVVTHDELLSALSDGGEYPVAKDVKYYAAVRTWRSSMLSYGIEIGNCHSVGYEVLDPSRRAVKVGRRTRIIERRVKDNMEHAIRIPVAELSESERRVLDHEKNGMALYLGHARATRSIAKAVYKEIEHK